MSAGDLHSLFVPAPYWEPATSKHPGGHLPPSVMKRIFLSANQRVHWQVRARVTRAWRHAAKVEAQRAFHGYGFKRVRIIATFSKGRGGRYDAANLSPVAKAICDGLVDAGLVPDDSNEYVVGPDCRPGAPAPSRPGVWLIIEELPERG